MEEKKEKGKALTVAIDILPKVAIAQSGVASRTYAALSLSRKPLTVQDIAVIAGLKASSVEKHGVRRLFNAQLVERKKTPRGIIYWLITSRAQIARS